MKVKLFDYGALSPAKWLLFKKRKKFFKSSSLDSILINGTGRLAYHVIRRDGASRYRGCVRSARMKSTRSTSLPKDKNPASHGSEFASGNAFLTADPSVPCSNNVWWPEAPG